jgi:hypothetical protein
VLGAKDRSADLHALAQRIDRAGQSKPRTLNPDLLTLDP